MEFILEPLGQTQPSQDTNYVCPGNAYQCGCNTIAGCACPKT